MFLVMAHRWGDRGNHSYVVGVWPDEQIEAALSAAYDERDYRGGKYAGVVYHCEYGTFNYCEVYRRKSVMED